MMRNLLAMSVVAVGLMLGGCDMKSEHHDHAAMMDGHDHASMWASVNRAVAVIYPTKGNQVSGTLYFDKGAAGVHIHGTISGLDPRSVHAMHIHEFGDQSSDDGQRWTSLPHTGFHAVSFPRRGTVGWAVGEGGRVARIRMGKESAR